MAVKKIKPGEEFQLHNQIFTYSVAEDGTISLKKLREGKTLKVNFIPPTVEQVIQYFKDNGYTEESAKKFHMSYSAGEPPWHDSKGNPVKAWKQKAINVWFKPENIAKGNNDNTQMVL